MTTWVKKLADWEDVRLASQKNISLSVQIWDLFNIQQGEEEGPTVAPTNGWAGLLTVADWQLLTNSHLPGGGAHCGTNQGLSRAPVAGVCLAATAPQAERCNCRKQPGVN